MTRRRATEHETKPHSQAQCAASAANNGDGSGNGLSQRALLSCKVLSFSNGQEHAATPPVVVQQHARREWHVADQNLRRV